MVKGNRQQCPSAEKALQGLIQYVSKNPRTFYKKNPRTSYKMLNAETALVNALLKFAVVDLSKDGLDNALRVLRNSFSVHLNRFPEMDLSSRAEDLLQIATNRLASALAGSSEKIAL